MRVALEHGIHARPAAQIVNALKGVSGQVSIAAQGRSANARSTVALMKLGVRKGDEVEVRATGGDARSAIDAVAALLTGRHGGAAGPANAAQLGRANTGAVVGRFKSNLAAAAGGN